jgi:hypothetical protein
MAEHPSRSENHLKISLFLPDNNDSSQTREDTRACAGRKE